MPRSSRVDVGGHIYHVINRAVGRLQIFNSPEEYLDFLNMIREVKTWVDVDLLAYTCMPNHWHIVMRTREDGDLSKFMHRLTNMHTRHVHSKTHTIGTGPLYQGRYKSFLVSSDEYLSILLRYVERNPVRARIVDRAEDWRWGSAWVRTNGNIEQKKILLPLELLEDEIYFPSNIAAYLEWVNTPDEDEILRPIRNAVKRGVPYGRPAWVSQMVAQYGLESTVRLPGGQIGVPKTKIFD